VPQLQDALLSFYRERGRDLPWRGTRDPYAIWVSEIMLQQTQVATAVPRFARFLARFPDVLALAKASERAVCQAWAGLGYYRRARHLHQAARVVARSRDGHFPEDAAAWRRLPGVGAYTAAAVASIAFGERVAAIDGNVLRVLARVFALPGSASDRRLRSAVAVRADRLVDCEQPGEINQALMDVGATLCRPATPRCHDCPLRRFCRARRAGNPAAYPGRRRQPARRVLRIAFAWSERGRSLLLEQRPLDGLWAGLWELPSASGPAAKRLLGLRLGQPLGPRLAGLAADLTHRHVEATVYRASAARGRGQTWWRDPLAAPLSSLARQAILAVRARSETSGKGARRAAARPSPRTRVAARRGRRAAGP
jgi:A/G-specific adenine glycosylase